MRLSAELNETVNLVVLDGAEALFVDGVGSRQPCASRHAPGPGFRPTPPAGGKVLLAHLPFRDRADALSRSD